MSTRIAFVADVHAANFRRFGGKMSNGVNQRFRLVQDALRSALEAAEASDAHDFVVLGDLFDVAKPSPMELAAVMGLFANSPLTIHLLLGNHDQSSDEPNDNALAPFRFIENVRVYTEPAVVGRLILVPFRAGPALEWLSDTLARLALPERDDYVLALHLGIADAKTPNFLRAAHDSVAVDDLFPLMFEYGIATACAGNWHDPRQWEVFDVRTDKAHRVFQVGTLAPTGFDNAGDAYGRMLVLDKKATVREVASRPRFLSLSYEDGDLPALRERTDRPFVKVTARVRNLAAATAELEELRVAGAIADFYVLPDREVVIAAAHSAAKAARAASTVDEAVARYVEKMPIAPGLDRQEVLEAVRKYLG